MKSIFNEIQINYFRSRITFLRFYSCINYATFKNDTIRKKYISHTHVIADDTNHEIGMSILRTYFPIMDSFRQMQNMDWGNINLSISIFINENFSHSRIGSTIFETIFIIFFGNESYLIMNSSLKFCRHVTLISVETKSSTCTSKSMLTNQTSFQFPNFSLKKKLFHRNTIIHNYLVLLILMQEMNKLFPPF